MSPQSTILNDWANYWFKLGVNVSPADTINKKPIVDWKQWQDKPMSIETFEFYKENGYYNKGIALIPGRLWRGPFEGKYLVAIDLDNNKAIEEFCRNNLEKLKQQTLVEQTANPEKMHIYFIVEREIPNKASDKVDVSKTTKIQANEIPALEVKSNGKGIMFCSYSPHEKDGNYQIKGTMEPQVFEAGAIQEQISIICDKFGIPYGSNNNGTNGYQIPIAELWKTETKIFKGHNRHLELLRIMESELQRSRGIKPLEDIKQIAQFWNQKHCDPPLDDKECEKQWKQAMEFIAESINNDYATAAAGNNTEENHTDENNNKNNSKTAILKQLKPEIREQLSKHVWEIIRIHPPKFVIAHSDFKQIIYAEIKKYNVPTKKDNTNDTIETETSEIISYLNLSSIVINAIPEEITLNKNPLGLFEHKYTIKFVTRSNDSFTIGPKTLDEMVTYLKDRSLVYMSTKTTEVLSIMISAFERNGQIITKYDIDTPGFYFIKGEIRHYNSNNTNNNYAHPKPTFDQTKTCCELLDILQLKFKDKDVLPTLLKWSSISPFNYILKQVHKKWMKWLYPYGWSNTGKSTLGDICCCIWNRYQDKDAILSFTAVDTKARLGEALSRSTYPLVVNEVGQLNDEHRNKDMVEMIKTAITDLNARKKFVNKTIYTDIPSFSPCILTGNSVPPNDTGFKRRIIPIVFTEKDQYSKDEIKEFEKLFHERVKHELRYLGDFAVDYIMEHQQELLLDGKKDWKEVAEIILTELYKSVDREPPEWIKYFVKESQLEDSKEDIDLLFRSFLINKVNETYNKYYRNIDKDNIVSNLPFSSRLNFCLENNLIPFLNLITTDGTTLIAITSDLVHELKQKISQISSLNEISSIIDGFNFGQKRIGGKNAKTVYGTKNDLLKFLGME